MRFFPIGLILVTAFSGWISPEDAPFPEETRLLALSGFINHAGTVSATLVPEHDVETPVRCEPYRNGMVHAEDECTIREGPPSENHHHRWYVRGNWKGSEDQTGEPGMKWREKDLAVFEAEGGTVARWDGAHPDFRMAIE